MRNGEQFGRRFHALQQAVSDLAAPLHFAAPGPLFGAAGARCMWNIANAACNNGVDMYIVVSEQTHSSRSMAAVGTTKSAHNPPKQTKKAFRVHVDGALAMPQTFSNVFAGDLRASGPEDL